MGKTGKIIMLSLFMSKINLLHAQLYLTRWQIGASAGVFAYQGDLSPSPLGSYKTLKPTLNLCVSRILSPSFSLRTNLAFGGLKGDESKYSIPAYRKERALSFSTPVTEISELLVWNLVGNNGNEIGNTFSLYLFGGAGVNFLNVKRANNLNKPYFANEPSVPAAIDADLKVTPPSKILVLPIGAGIEYYVSPNISLTAETMFRYTRTDYLDGYSIISKGHKDDTYQSHTIGIVFKFNAINKLDCPRIKNN